MIPSPCQKQRQEKMAGFESNQEERPLYDQMLEKLGQHKVDLKAIESKEEKGILKADIVEEYDDYINGVIDSKDGHQNDVVSTLAVWNFDAKRIDRGIEITEYCIKHDIKPPHFFKSKFPTILARELIEKWEIVTEQQFVLARVIIEDLDMVDELKANFYKKYGLKIEENEPDIALELFERAMSLDPKSGLKGVISKLEKKLTS